MASRIRIHSPVGKSNTPINTTLVAKQQKQQPINTPKLDCPDPKFNFDLSKIPVSSPHKSSQPSPKINPKLVDNKSGEKERETESKNSATTIQTFTPSPPGQPQEADETKNQLQQPEIRAKSESQQPKADVSAEIKRRSRYNFDLSKIPISAPNRPPVQTKPNFDIPSPDRLQQPIDGMRARSLTEEPNKSAISSRSASRSASPSILIDNSDFAERVSQKERSPQKDPNQSPLKGSPLEPKVARKPLIANPYKSSENKQLASGEISIQRLCSECEKEQEKKKDSVQRKLINKNTVSFKNKQNNASNRLPITQTISSHLIQSSILDYIIDKSSLYKAWFSLPKSVKIIYIDAVIDIVSSKLQSTNKPQFGGFWPLVKTGLVGFLQRVKAEPVAQKLLVINKVIKLTTATSLKYVWAILKGIVQGFFIDGLCGIIIAIYELIQGFYDLDNLLDDIAKIIGGFPREVEEIIHSYQQLSQIINSQKDAVFNELFNLVNNPANITEGINQIYQIAQSYASQLGKGIAEKLIEFFVKPSAEEDLGKGVGRVFGMILFEIVATVVTKGANVGVAAAKTATRLVAKITGKFVAGILKVLRSIYKAFDPVIDLVRNLSKFVKGKILPKVTEKFGNLLTKVKKILKLICENCTNPKLKCPGLKSKTTRKPKGFEPTSQGTKKRVKAGTLEGLESHRYKTPKHKQKSVTREQQLEGIEFESLYNKLRGKTPSKKIQDEINAVPQSKKVDPVYKYSVDTLEADHIVSMKKIFEMKGFSQLSEANQLKVLNYKKNFMGLGKRTNASKGAKSWSEWEGHSELGPISPEFKAKMIKLEKQLEIELQELIQELLKSQNL